MSWGHLREIFVEGNADTYDGEDNERYNGENRPTNKLDDDKNAAIVDTDRKTTLNNDPGPLEENQFGIIEESKKGYLGDQIYC